MRRWRWVLPLLAGMELASQRAARQPGKRSRTVGQVVDRGDLTIKGNLFWAFAYNLAALPLAALGLLNP